MHSSWTKFDALNELCRVGLTPRGLSRIQAAGYIGVSPSLFDLMVKDGRMPKPKEINSRVVWDLRKLDTAFDLLPDVGGATLDPDKKDIWGCARV
jgi:predicted DNA-binding transcriptional regulator AlpA